MIRDDLLSIYEAALQAADPASAVAGSLRFEGGALAIGTDRFPLSDFERVVVAGAGKATARMAAAVERILGDRLDEGVIIVKDGHAAPLAKVRQWEAGHPIPDERGVAGTAEIIRLLEQAGERTLVLCLLSGGGSSMLVAPAPGITLTDKQRTTELLLSAGATIDELNAVRKHLSAVKGGRLARTASPATVLTLVLSDVIGDRLDVIASGPTVPDRTTFHDALRVIHKYALEDRIPAGVFSILHMGRAGIVPDTPKRFDDPGRVRSIIIGSIGRSLAAAAARARELGYRTEIVTPELQGEAREAAKMLAGRARDALRGLPPDGGMCLLSGGETTVTVRGTGTGGRNQELALAFALEIEGNRGITLLSAGTDGTDGPTDAAGAIVDGSTAGKARSVGLSPEAHLSNNDSYTFFSKLDAVTGGQHHLKTGPTGTNVMDIQLILIES